MASFEVGDEVVYSPHGAGIVVAKEQRDDNFGEYLSIRIAHSKMTLMVPSSAATDKGVRPVMSASAAKKLLKELGNEPNDLPDNPQHRARQTADNQRIGGVEQLAGILRDYAGRVRGGKKLSAAEQKPVANATLLLASEIALALDIPIDKATEKIEAALVHPE
jgi:CarD family transcriptional regulator